VLVPEAESFLLPARIIWRQSASWWWVHLLLLLVVVLTGTSRVVVVLLLLRQVRGVSVHALKVSLLVVVVVVVVVLLLLLLLLLLPGRLLRISILPPGATHHARVVPHAPLRGLSRVFLPVDGAKPRLSSLDTASAVEKLTEQQDRPSAGTGR